jgi:hypothetical protein
MTPENQPGDAYLDRYLPHLPPEQREEVRAALVAFARILVRAGEKVQTRQRMADSTE